MRILFFLLLFSCFANASNISLKLKGTIGNYPVEFIFNDFNNETGDLIGKYRYANKKSYLNLEGTLLGNVIYLEESYNGEATGSFFLDVENDTLSGTWISAEGDKDLAVQLNMEGESTFSIHRLELEEISAQNKVSADLTGSYGVEFFWINDMWFSEEARNMEIGFNGGFAVLEQLGTDSLHFRVEVICGPTYHFAMADGIAYLQDTAYIYTNEDGCEISISGGGKKAQLVANMSFECGFGARAYLDHEFVKITDVPVFDENISLENLRFYDQYADH
jgi:hypothetical protein